MLAGSPGFQSPEQLKNESTGLPSDIYAYGAVLVVLFGESPVWPGLPPYQIMYKVAVANEKPSIGHLPQKFKNYAVNVLMINQYAQQQTLFLWKCLK